MLEIYKCDCGWIGTESEMLADHYKNSDDSCDESWSNWICPSCLMWQELDDYELIAE